MSTNGTPIVGRTAERKPVAGFIDLDSTCAGRQGRRQHRKCAACVMILLATGWANTSLLSGCSKRHGAAGGPDRRPESIASAPHREPDLSADSLHRKLQEMDARYASGFTATGTFVSCDTSSHGEPVEPPTRHEWKLSMMHGQIAYESQLIEVLRWEDVLGPNEKLPQTPEEVEEAGGFVMPLRTTIFVRREYYGAYYLLCPPPSPGRVAPWSDNEPGLAVTGSLTIYPLRDPAELGKIHQRMYVLGRWYSQYIDHITSVSRNDDGTLSLTADGTMYKGEEYSRRLKWQIVVDPDAGYMARSVTRDVVGIDDEHSEMTASGTMRDGPVCVPETVTLSTRRMPYVTTSVSAKADVEFIRKAESRIHGPYVVRTMFWDRRLPQSRPGEFKAGESWMGR